VKGTWWLTITGWTILVDLPVTYIPGIRLHVYISWHIGMLSKVFTDTSKATIIRLLTSTH
jgi:hypothetical protein